MTWGNGGGKTRTTSAAQITKWVEERNRRYELRGYQGNWMDFEDRHGPGVEFDQWDADDDVFFEWDGGE